MRLGDFTFDCEGDSLLFVPFEYVVWREGSYGRLAYVACGDELVFWEEEVGDAYNLEEDAAVAWA